MEFDTLITKGTVVDGSGQKTAFRADVGISEGKITAIGNLGNSSAASTIDASGLVVSPGFIDVHIHSETNLIDESCAHRYGALYQGVTTHLMAPDGFGWAQLSEDKARQLWQSTEFAYGATDLDFAWPTPNDYLAIFAGRTPANVVPQIPHLAVRMAVMGWDARPATDDEIDAMKPLVQAWLDAGAVAFNTGLDYQPASSADLRELVELCKVAAADGVMYAAHIRYSDYGKEGAWKETFDLADQARIPVHISHEHVDPVTAPLLDEAADRCDLTFESYMYPAGCTHLSMMLPTWAQAGGPEAIRDRLTDPATRETLRIALQEKLSGPLSRGKPVFAETQTGRYIGQSLAHAADAEGLDIGEFAVRVILEEHPYALMVYHRDITPEALETRIRDTIQHPRMMVASDGIYHGRSGHPRGFGCFTRALRLGVRELNAVTLEQAVHKMSGLPAERFGIPERGVLKENYAADIVIFDPETVADQSTWTDPFAQATGIDRVIVNGQSVIATGRPTESLPGKVLARS